MSFSDSQIPNVRKAFQSILRADYVSISDIDKLKELDEYYVDYFRNLSKVLQNQDSYINGRRGAGKTVLLMRAYYECLKTVSPRVKEQSEFFPSEKILPIYIDLSQCIDIFSEEGDSQFERNFLMKLVDDLKNQLKTIFNSHNMKIFSRNYSEMDEFNQIRDLLVNGILLKKSEKNITVSKNNDIRETCKGRLNLSNPEVNAISSNVISINKSANIDEQRSISVEKFLSFLATIRIESNLDAIYVFVDEFSDLTEEQQKRFANLLKKLLGSKNNIFFKIGTITDRFYFGDNIIIGRDIYPISLDLNDFVERNGGIIIAAKKLQEFTIKLIEKRLFTYADNVSINDLFGVKKSNQDEIFTRISREAIGVPRTIGMILQGTLAQAETRSGRITLQLNDINVGIRETRKTYFKQFEGAIRKGVIPAFYMDMWNALLKKALDEKKSKSERPASHFMIDPVRKKYLNVFCENFMVHCLEDSRASKYGGNYALFAFDFDICNENNIIYADDKDEFTSVRFIYDKVLQDFDSFFLKDKIKSYRCPLCNKIYDEKEVSMMKKKKRCFECDCELEEIIHCETPITEGNYTEVEVKILGIIGTLTEEDAMTASEIAEAVGCSYQKVANWCGKFMKRNELVSVINIMGKNYYYDNSKCVSS